MLQAADRILRDAANPSQRIVLVGSDASARGLLADQFTLQGDYGVDEADSGTVALALVERRPYAALLAESPLPDMDGYELCRMLRRRNFTAPIILLSSTGSDTDAILSLDAGADDVVVKPYRFGVLAARLRAHLRRYDHSDDAVLTIGPYRFLPARKELVEISRRRRIRLTEKEAALLKYLYRNRGASVSRAAIMRDVWGLRTDLETHMIETHIYRLRRKIEPDLPELRIILSVPGEGYCLGTDETTETRETDVPMVRHGGTPQHMAAA